MGAFGKVIANKDHGHIFVLSMIRYIHKVRFFLSSPELFETKSNGVNLNAWRATVQSMYRGTVLTFPCNAKFAKFPNCLSHPRAGVSDSLWFPSGSILSTLAGTKVRAACCQSMALVMPAAGSTHALTPAGAVVAKSPGPSA